MRNFLGKNRSRIVCLQYIDGRLFVCTLVVDIDCHIPMVASLLIHLVLLLDLLLASLSGALFVWNFFNTFTSSLGSAQSCLSFLLYQLLVSCLFIFFSLSIMPSVPPNLEQFQVSSPSSLCCFAGYSLCSAYQRPLLLECIQAIKRYTERSIWHWASVGSSFHNK